MIYWDLLHRTIDFGQSAHSDLLADLLATPEVHRLRHMRLMNFDVPYIQDLATAKRYPHSVGTCFLAQQLLAKSYLSDYQSRALLAAALIHDIGILPYGHLVETMLRKRNPAFSHESLVRQILHGTYHPTNTYHQILLGQSLQVSRILEKHHLDPENVLRLIAPTKGDQTAISSDIDLDNIDNIHRMAMFLGFTGVQENVHTLLMNITIDPDSRLVFSRGAMPAIDFWFELRNAIYSMIIAHPACVAYNAFLADLVEASIDNQVVNERNWFISDLDFEVGLLANHSTRQLASQLITGCRYSLIDYVWLRSYGSPPISEWSSIDLKLKECLPEPPGDTSRYFFWVEHKLVSRTICPVVKGYGPTSIGNNSVSLLIALVNQDNHGSSEVEYSKQRRSTWRTRAVNETLRIAKGWSPSILFPEDFDFDVDARSTERKQLALF
jgi:HD superfamily phosphohydrolase